MMNALESRLVKYSASIIRLSANLKNLEAADVLRKQILRSGTSVALNYGEAQNAESKRDFIHKVRIAYKELRETFLNLKIIEEARLYRNDFKIEEVLVETGELLAIFTSILKTANSRK